MLVADLGNILDLASFGSGRRFSIFFLLAASEQKVLLDTRCGRLGISARARFSFLTGTDFLAISLFGGDFLGRATTATGE